jgi:hypothetical protein
MNNYQTTYTMNAPLSYAGNASTAKLNYLLGNNPYNPGAAPTAPTAPTLASAEASVTPEQLQNYIQANMTTNGFNAGPGQQQAYIYSGAGAFQPDGTPINWTPGTGINIDLTGAHDYGGAAGFAADPTINAAATQYLGEQALTQDQTNYQSAEQAYTNQDQLYNQNEALYNQYTQQGPLTAASLNNMVSNLPGYQFNLNQGINAIQNAASASGQLNGGNMLQALSTFGQGQASNYYNQYIGNLQQLAGLGTSATSTNTSNTNAEGSALSSLIGNEGTNLANGELATGQSQSSSYLSNAALNSQYLGGGSNPAYSLLGSALGNSSLTSGLGTVLKGLF